MAVHLIFHIVDDILGDKGIQIILQYAEQSGNHRCTERSEHQQYEQPQILVWQSHVDNLLNQDRRQQPQNR
ncbi:hypothetical protein D3C79_851940 [compost metagenome]